MPCVFICKACFRLFSHPEEFPFVAVLEGTKGSVLRALSLEGLFENSDFMTFHFSWLHGT